MYPSLKSTLLPLLCVQLCSALYHAKGTPCSSQCNSTGGTYWPDLVCSTDDFASTSKGQTLQACLSCTIDSLYINSSYTDGNSDQFWTLFHMKYVQGHCLIDNNVPHIAAVNACTSACSPLTDVLNVLWINKHPFVGQYDYCTADSSAYPAHAGDCARCLQSQEQSVIIGNFVETMNQACNARPLAASGELIVPNRDLFDTSILSSSATSAGSSTMPASTSGHSSATRPTSATGTSSSSAGSATAGTVSDSNPASNKNDSGKSSTLSTGAAAGIGAGIAVVVIVAIVAIGFIIFRRRQNQNRKLQPQSLAVELSPHPSSATDQNTKQGPYVFEKAASTLDGQLHEAPNESQSRLVELPTYTRR